MLKKSASIVLRIVQALNVPQRVRLGSSLAAALLDGHFEHSAGKVFLLDRRLQIISESFHVCLIKFSSTMLDPSAEL